MNQSIKKIRDIIDNGKENKNVVVNKNEDNANKNIVLPGKKISILDILSNKNKKIKHFVNMGIYFFISF